MKKKEDNILFNDALNTFYLRLYDVRHMVKGGLNTSMFTISLMMNAYAYMGWRGGGVWPTAYAMRTGREEGVKIYIFFAYVLYGRHEMFMGSGT